MRTPDKNDEKELLSLDRNTKTPVHIPFSKKIYQIGWLKGYTLERLSKLQLQDGSDNSDAERKKVSYRSKFQSKAASFCILNGIRIVFFHWFFWRYLYYVQGFTFSQLQPIIETAQKKSLATSWLVNSILLSDMMITKMVMTRDELQNLKPSPGQFPAEPVSE